MPGNRSNDGLNEAAYADPGDNIGRVGSAARGDVVGRGTQAVSMSLLKQVPITERVRFQFGAQAANLFNHPNYAPPSNLTVGVPAFGGPGEVELDICAAKDDTQNRILSSRKAAPAGSAGCSLPVEVPPPVRARPMLSCFVLIDNQI
jgi:hypothetical protein